MYDGFDLHPGEEREDYRRERGQQVEPLLTLDVEDVAEGDADGQLDERDGDAELDRDDACEKDGGGENRRELDWLHR
jgi:hypothetical protein